MSIDNPPAFPEVPADCNAYEGREGMTLRDHFAGIALPLTWAEVAPLGEAKGFDAETVAKAAACGAYQLADAMLAERNVVR
jgi:hypothetical protein